MTKKGLSSLCGGLVLALAAGPLALAQTAPVWTRTWEAVAVSAPAAPAAVAGPATIVTTTAPPAPPPAAPPAATVASAAAAPRPPAPSLADVTIRMPLRISAGGDQLRLRLSNELSTVPLSVGAVHVALLDASGAVVAGSDRVVRFSGAGSTVIPPNAPLVSDPISLTVPALSHLAVSLYLPDASHATLHSSGGETGAIGPGDQTAAASVTGGRTTPNRYVLTGVDVAGGTARSTVVTLGDSITEGAMSTPNTDRRWPDTLAERLNTAKIPVSVANAGISGNRLLLNGSGPDILARLDRDVLSAPNLKYVIVLEAINDIGHGATGDPMPTVDQIAGIYQQIIQRAHDRGVKVIGGTVLPYGGAKYDSDAGEVVRQGVNAWIRAPGHFDGVIDFDKATADPSNPRVMLPAYDSGDHLHPNDPGNNAMAQAIDLKLFK